MKKTFVTTSIKVVLLIVATITTFGTSARAQSLDHGFRINIPFDFMVGGKTLPAGQYSVARVLSGSGEDLRLANRKRKRPLESCAILTIYQSTASSCEIGQPSYFTVWTTSTFSIKCGRQRRITVEKSQSRVQSDKPKKEFVSPLVR